MRKTVKTTMRGSISFADQNSEDIEVLVLGELGLFSRAIAEKTGLTVNQVNYRLNKANVTRRAYREGTSSVFKRVATVIAPELKPSVYAAAREVMRQRNAEKERKRIDAEKLKKRMTSAVRVSKKK